MKNEMTQRVALEYVIENCELPKEVYDKVVAMRDKLAQSKPKAEKPENADIRGAIVKVLTGNSMRLSDITKGVNAELGTDYSSNKVSAQITKLRATEEVTRTEVKGVAYFSC